MTCAQVSYIQGLQFAGTASSGHAVVMDVVSILIKKRQDITGIEINTKGQRADTYPKQFTEIKLEFVVKGKNVSEEAVEQSIELSINKYCSIKASLEGTSSTVFL